MPTTIPIEEGLTPTPLQIALAIRSGFLNWPKLMTSLALGRYLRMTGEVQWRSRDGLRFWTPINDSAWWSALETLVWHEYPFERIRGVKDVRSFLDLGANVGITTLAMSRWFPNAAGIAVEPSPSSFDYLLRNLGSAGIATRIQAVRAAVAPSGVQSVRLSLSHHDSCRTVVESLQFSSGADGQQFASGESAPGLSLASLVDRVGGHVDLLKIDIEGSEYLLLEDFKRLPAGSIRAVLAEYHASPTHSLADLVAALGHIDLRLVWQKKSSTAGVGLAFFEYEQS